MLAYCDYNLLKDENTDEVNCKADFHFLAFHQKCTIHECINLCAIPTVVVHLTFCQQIAHFLVTSHSTISIHSTFVSVTFYLPVAFYLQATCIHMHN